MSAKKLIDAFNDHLKVPVSEAGGADLPESALRDKI